MDDPSTFPVACPGCRATYFVPVDRAGQPATCDGCQTDFILPEVPVPPHPPAPPLPASASARRGGNAAGAIFKNILLLLSGAALVLGVSSYLKNRQQTAASYQTAAAPLPSAPEPDAEPDPALTEPVITTTRPARLRPKLPPAQPAEEPPALTPSTPAPPLPPLAPPPAAPAEVPSGPLVTTIPLPPAAEIAAAAPATTNAAPATADFSKLRHNSRLTLERFLLAGSMGERLALSQNPDKIRPAMEQHYRTWPDGPVPLQGIVFLTDGEVPDTNRKFHLYNVSLKDQEAPIPLAVEETSDGYRVDWPTFAESYTHALAAFFAAPVETPGRFRVMLRRTHYFGPPVPGQDTVRIAYTVEPPTRDETFHVWVDKDSLVYKEKLATGERAGWDAESYVIVELLWKGDDKRGRWVGLHRIPADSWRAE